MSLRDRIRASGTFFNGGNEGIDDAGAFEIAAAILDEVLLHEIHQHWDCI
jgi:hypothetical protein